MGILINGDDGNTDGDAVLVILLKIIKKVEKTATDLPRTVINLNE